mgnify:CR=1 FL=1
MSVATHRKGRRVAAARYPYQAVRGPRGLAVNGLLPLIKLLTLLWFTILVIFNYILNTNLFTVGTYGTVLLPACTGTAVPPPFGYNRPKIAVKATATPLRRPVSIALGLKRLALRPRCSLLRCVSATHRRQRARRTMKLLVALSLFGAAAAVELTPDKRSSGVPSLAYIRSNALAHPAQLGRHDRWQDGLYQIPGALVRALQEDETCVGRRHGGLRGPPHEARR